MSSQTKLIKLEEKLCELKGLKFLVDNQPCNRITLHKSMGLEVYDGKESKMFDRIYERLRSNGYISVFQKRLRGENSISILPEGLRRIQELEQELEVV